MYWVMLLSDILSVVTLSARDVLLYIRSVQSGNGTHTSFECRSDFKARISL